VNVTSWHGVPILVANGILTAELVNPLLESGDGPYLWIWYTAAVTPSWCRSCSCAAGFRCC
jgi:hypothetical protein